MPDPTPNAQQSWDVAVIGGGIVGFSSALELQQQGRKVVLIDPDQPRSRASFGNAGTISRYSIFTVAGPAIWGKALPYLLNRSAALRLRYSAFPNYARWLAHFLSCCTESHRRRSAVVLNPFIGAAYDHHVRLAKYADATALVKQDGSLELFRNEQTFESDTLTREMLTEAGVRYSMLNRGEIRDLEPSLADVFSKGLLIHDSGSVDSPGRLLEFYQKAFLARGGTLIPTHARAIEPGSSSVTVHLRTGGSVRSTRAVVAAGVWSAELIAPLGYRIPVTAERGYHIHLELRPGAAIKRPLFDIDMSYGAAPMGEAIRICTGIELARPEDPPDYTQLKLATERARSAVPVGAAVKDSEWVGSRPSTADGLPIIGRSRRHPQLYFAFGHGHVGLSTGPVTGRMIAALMANETPPVPTAPFAIERFD